MVTSVLMTFVFAYTVCIGREMHEFIRVTLLIDIMDEITNLHVHFASVVYVDLVFKAVILTFHL